jgi:hypothetical protein
MDRNGNRVVCSLTAIQSCQINHPRTIANMTPLAIRIATMANLASTLRDARAKGGGANIIGGGGDSVGTRIVCLAGFSLGISQRVWPFRFRDANVGDSRANVSLQPCVSFM